MKHHILSIGISKHQMSGANLSYASKDAQEFFELFISNIGNLGYKRLLIDSEATLGQIRGALGQELQDTVEPGDAFFFFYSGHGVVAEDLLDSAYDSHYLVPFDATFDYLNTCIPVSYLRDSLEKLKATASLVFIDSCFSGAAAKNSKGYPGPRKKAIKVLRTFSNTLSGVGKLTITASKDDEEAIEDPEFKNGLFSYYLFAELQRKKDGDSFPVLDIFTPVSTQVTKRAKEKYNHTQTPTLSGQLQGAMTLPIFVRLLKVSPQVISPPRAPELAAAAFPSVLIELDDKAQEKMLNELVDMVTRGREQQPSSAAIISFERYCSQLIKALKTEWERIFLESAGDTAKIPVAVAKLEGAAYQLTILGAVVAVFGSDTQMKIYSEAVVDIWQFTQNRSGLVALIAAPEIILGEIIYVVGVICIARENMRPWKILLQTPIYELYRRDAPPTPLLLYEDVHYCDSLGGYSTTVNDHIRQALNNMSWISAIAPKVEGQVTEYQLQANLLLVLLFNHNGQYLWPDFARWYPQRVRSLVNKTKYNTEFRLQMADLFDIKQETIGATFSKYLNKAAERGLDRYIWHSIDPDEFFTDEEKKALQ
jgi:hypothetical protein